MMLNTQKRLAASLLKCSKGRVWFDDSRLDEIKEAITKEDIRGLISDKAIVKKPTTGSSMFWARQRMSQKRKGRYGGHGSRKGKKGARLESKLIWIQKSRSQRDLLKKLREKKIISPDLYRALYRKVKGGFFRSRRHIKLFIQEHGLK